jgi:hypothetical protein
MNSYKRIYELLLEEAFLLEQRKPLTWKKKLGAGVSGEIGPISKPSDAAERVIDQMANQRSTRRLQKLVDRSNKIVRKAKKAAAETPWIGGPGDPASEPTEDEWYDIISKNKGETDITAISRRIPGQVLSRTGKMYDKAGGKELGKRSRLEKDSPGFEERRKKARREVFRSADLRASRRFYKEQELQKEKEQELQKENAYNRIYDLSLEIRKKPGEMI